MFHRLATLLVASVLLYMGWRLSLPNQAPTELKAHPDRPLHLAVHHHRHDMCPALPRYTVIGAVGPVMLLGLLCYTLFGTRRALAVAPPLPQHGPLAVPRPVYGPTHRTVPPPTKPLRQRSYPDWFCCCKAERKPGCGCDRTEQ